MSLFIWCVCVCCRGLRRLNVSSLPKLRDPGLVIILLEEMLPLCEVTAMGYDLSFRQEGGNEEEKEEDQGGNKLKLRQL